MSLIIEDLQEGHGKEAVKGKEIRLMMFLSDVW